MPGAASNEGQWPYNLVGRMRAGVTADQVRAELAGYLARKAYVPGEPRDVRASVRSIESLIVGDVKPALLALAGAVALLLGLANVNVANLFLVRGIARRRELAVRAAIGASRWRIGGSSSPKLVLSTLGGVAGVALAAWLLQLLVALAPAELPRVDDIRMDFAVLVAAAAMVMGSALAFSFGRPSRSRGNATCKRAAVRHENRRDEWRPGAREAFSWSPRSRWRSSCSSVPGCSAAPCRCSSISTWGLRAMS